MSTIEKGIDIPHPPFKIKWHFRDFEIADSKAIPFENNELEVTRFRVAASAFGKRNNLTFVSRTTYENGKGEPGDIKMLRIWRTQ
tara:strand:- start:427 stop:681 length:255 start_codon:yes stop_codon:yes gene_type:complete